MRNKKSCRPTVLRGKIFVVKSKCDPPLLVHLILQRQICAVVAIRMNKSILGIGFYVCKQRIEENAFPSRAEFRPSRNAVQISGDGFVGQLAKRFPIPSL